MSPSVETVLPRNRPRFGALCMLLSIVFFSANTLTLKHLSQSDVSPWIALMVRAVIGMLVVVSLFRSGKSVSFRRALTSRMLAYRGLMGVLGTIAYYLTIPDLGPGKATIISNTYVVISALMAVWFLKETLSARKLFGNLLALVGLTMLIASPAQLHWFGWSESLAVFGAFMAAGTVIVIRKLTLTESTAMIYTSQCVYVLIGSLPFAIYEMQGHPIGIGNLYWLVLAGISATIGQLAMTEGFRHLTVTVGSTFQICVPLVIAIGGVTLFGETFTQAQLLGAVLILGGCYCVTALR
ncbi:MAG: DMT family transporter [Pirellula sp.]